MKSFALRSDLTRHIQAKHRLGLAQHACLVEGCHYKTTRKDNIQQHLRNIHPEIAGSSQPKRGPRQGQAHTILSPVPLSVQPETDSDLSLVCISTLMQAASSGNSGICEAVFRLGVEISVRADDGSTVLHCAAKANQVDMVRLLIQKGIQLEIQNKKGRTALHEAVLGRQESTFTVLVQSGAAITEHVLRDIIETEQIRMFQVALTRYEATILQSYGPELFAIAANCTYTGMMDTMLALPTISERWIEQNGKQTIHRLIIRNCTVMMGVLMTSGKLDINMCIMRRQSLKPLLQIAASHGLYEMASLFLTSDAIEVNQRGNNGYTALDVAAEEGHIKIVEALLEHPRISVHDNSAASRRNTTGLHIACRRGHHDIVNLMVTGFQKHGVSVNTMAGGVSTVQTPFQSAVLHGRTEIVSQLLPRPDFDVNIPYQKRTIWEAASRLGHTDMLRILLGHERIDCLDFNLHSLWSLVEAFVRSYWSVIRVLLEYNRKSASIGRPKNIHACRMEQFREPIDLLDDEYFLNLIRKYKPRSLWHLAVQQNDLAMGMLLLEHSQRNKGFEHPAIDVNYRPPYDNTPLLLAVFLGRTEMIKLLLLHNNINVNLHDTTREMPGSAIILDGFKTNMVGDSEKTKYIRNLLLVYGSRHVGSVNEESSGGRLSTNMAEGSQHATSSLVTGVRLVEASNEETERGNQATDVMDDLTDYEDDVDFEDTMFDEWMNFNNIDMDECNSTSMPGDEGFNNPPNATHGLPSWQSEGTTEYSSGAGHGPWEY